MSRGVWAILATGTPMCGLFFLKGVASNASCMRQGLPTRRWRLERSMADTKSDSLHKLDFCIFATLSAISSKQGKAWMDMLTSPPGALLATLQSNILTGLSASSSSPAMQMFSTRMCTCCKGSLSCRHALPIRSHRSTRATTSMQGGLPLSMTRASMPAFATPSTINLLWVGLGFPATTRTSKGEPPIGFSAALPSIPGVPSSAIDNLYLPTAPGVHLISLWPGSLRYRTCKEVLDFSSAVLSTEELDLDLLAMRLHKRSASR
mmetsp:Transcript_8756/g.24047  ORF Transcript_8756/g.24047 Transcript_8756/m.24047 type:complete len:263 (-) Transcript_8756:419-1207(-)